MQILRTLSRQARYVLPAGVFTGVLLPDLASALRFLLLPVILIMLSGALLRLDWRALGAYGRRPGVGMALCAWQLVASPLLVWGGAALLGLPPVLAQTLVLNASAPPITGNAVFAHLLGLDAPLVVYCIVLTTLLLPLTLVPVTAYLLETPADIDLLWFFLRVSAFIGGPFIVAAVLRRLLGAARINRQAASIDGINIVCLLIFAIAVMDGVTARLLSEPQVVAAWVLAACLLNAALHLGGFLVFARMGMAPALSAAMCSGNRNLGLTLAVTTGIAGPDFALYVGVAQLPMYFVPIVLAPIARRVVPDG